jgi:hypothetical protein
MGTLQLRRLNAQSPEPLRSATGTVTFSTILWSSDSKYLIFPDGQTLKRIRVPDGAPEVVGRLPGAFPSEPERQRHAPVRVLPARQSRIVPGSRTRAEPMEISVPGLEERTFFGPWFLPDGEDFLISVVAEGKRRSIATYPRDVATSRYGPHLTWGASRLRLSIRFATTTPRVISIVLVLRTDNTHTHTPSSLVHTHLYKAIRRTIQTGRPHTQNTSVGVGALSGPALGVGV